MKITVFLFILVLSSMAIAETPTKISWTLQDAQNMSHDFPQQAIANEQVTLLFFWATWCPYCQQLMPHIQSALYQYETSLNMSVYALSINEDDDPAAYLRSKGFSFKLFPQAESVAEQYKIFGTPGVLIVNQAGEIVFDLRDVQTQQLVNKKASHGAKSVRLAPYWAAAIRKALQELLETT